MRRGLGVEVGIILHSVVPMQFPSYLSPLLSASGARFTFVPELRPFHLFLFCFRAFRIARRYPFVRPEPGSRTPVVTRWKR